MRIFSLPNVPLFYPGEILGHWMARVATRFGSESWFRFVRQYSDQRFPKSFVDSRFTSRRNVFLSSVIEALGLDFENVLATMTLLPYWGRFLDEDGSLALRNAPSELHFAGKLALPHPRFCADCIRNAVECEGEPYLLLKHQLPNVYGCDVHHPVQRNEGTNLARCHPARLVHSDVESWKKVHLQSRTSFFHEGLIRAMTILSLYQVDEGSRIVVRFETRFPAECLCAYANQLPVVA